MRKEETVARAGRKVRRAGRHNFAFTALSSNFPKRDKSVGRLAICLDCPEWVVVSLDLSSLVHCQCNTYQTKILNQCHLKTTSLEPRNH